MALLYDGPIRAIACDRTRYGNQSEWWNMPFVLQMSAVLGIVGVIASFLILYLVQRVFHQQPAALARHGEGWRS